jgi:hypothetical protein
MKVANLRKSTDFFYIDLHIYPGQTLADPLCKLSEHGKAFSFPEGSNPKKPWTWKYACCMLPAITTLLSMHEFRIDITDE